MEVHEPFYGKYDRIFRACTNSVYQAYPQGEGPGDEVKTHVDTLVSLTTQSGNDTSLGCDTKIYNSMQFFDIGAWCSCHATIHADKQIPY